MLLPSSKRLVPQSWNTSNRMFQTKHKLGIELNFFAEPDVVEYSWNNRPQYDLIIGPETMKELGIVLDFRAKTITNDEVILPMRNINHLQGTSMLRVLKLDSLSAMDGRDRPLKN
jgi:hypothetical protein